MVADFFLHAIKKVDLIMNKQVSENPEKNRRTNLLLIVTSLMVTIYLASNAMAVKIIAAHGVALFDAGTITFPFAYMLGDVLAEVWGFKVAKKVIWLTFICNIIYVICTWTGVFLPSPDYMKETADAYAIVFGYVPRIVVASLVAYICGELLNAWVLDKIKEKTGKKHLWVRTIGSSAVAYVIDTGIFVVIAFVGRATVSDIVSMFCIQYFTKLITEAVFGTPLAYLVIKRICK